MCDVGCEQVPNKHVICQYDSIVMISHFRKNQKIPKTKIWFKELSKRCILLSELRSLSKIQGNISKKAIEFRVLLLHITPPPPPRGFGDLFWQNVLPTKIATRFDKGWMKRGTYYTVLQNYVYVQKAIQNLTQMLPIGISYMHGMTRDSNAIYRWDTKPLPGFQWKVKVSKNYRLYKHVMIWFTTGIMRRIFRIPS